MADLNKYLEQLQEFDINEVDWDRIGVWPAPIKITLCITLFALILVGCHFLLVKERSEALSVERSKETALKRSFEEKAFEAANLDRYRKQMKEMSGTLDTLISRLPLNIEVPGLLEDIEDKSTESNATIDDIKVQNEVLTDFNVEMPIKINLTGGYHEFGAFVSGIAGMPRIVTLHDFSIMQKTGVIGQLEMDILAKTYRYKARE
ncbi:MAG: type IV pilus assembly protein PilO [Lentisphaeria bacterium]|jgi:type IV pilus assembly protein PilO